MPKRRIDDSINGRTSAGHGFTRTLNDRRFGAGRGFKPFNSLTCAIQHFCTYRPSRVFTSSMIWSYVAMQFFRGLGAGDFGTVFDYGHAHCGLTSNFAVAVRHGQLICVYLDSCLVRAGNGCCVVIRLGHDVLTIRWTDATPPLLMQLPGRRRALDAAFGGQPGAVYFPLVDQVTLTSAKSTKNVAGGMRKM